jgi:hypothetical protein
MEKCWLRLHWLSVDGGGQFINLWAFSLLGIVTHVRSIWILQLFLFFPNALPGRIFSTFECKKLGHRGRKLKVSISCELFHKTQSVLMVSLGPLNNLSVIHSFFSATMS